MTQPLRYLSLLLLLVVMSCTAAFAQKEGQAKIDSLLRMQNRDLADTDKIKSLFSLSFEYNSINPDEGIKYGKRALALADKISWDYGLSNAYNAVGVNFEAKSEYDSALKNYTKALSISKKIDNKVSIANNLGNIANTYYHLGDYPRALEIHQSSLKIKEDNKLTYGIASTLSNIGNIYIALSRYPQALEYYFKALKSDESIKDSAGIATDLLNIGLIYHYQKNYPKALEYFNNSLRINISLGDKTGIAACYANKGVIEGLKGNYAQALDYHLKAKAMHTEISDKANIANDLDNIGSIYSKMGNWSQTLTNLTESLKLSEELGSQHNAAISLGNIGAAYLAIAKTLHDKPVCSKSDKYNFAANLQVAISYLNRGIAACKTIKDNRNIAEFYKALSEAHELAGNYKEGLASQKEYVKYNDYVFSIQNQEMLANIENERDMELKNKELKIKTLELSNKRRDSIILILCISFLLVITAWVWKNFRTAKNSNMVLTEEKKHHIEQIEEQNKVLMDIAYTQSHNVRGPVSTIMGLVQHYNFDDPADPTNKELIDGITSVSKKLDEIVTDVVQKVNTLEKDKENGFKQSK